MNIGIVTAWFPAGAGYVSKAYRKVLEKEHAVFIYARAGETRKGDPVWDDGSVTWAPPHYVSTGIWPRHFRAWIRSKKLDLIIFNEQRQWLPVVVAKKEGVVVGAYVDYYTQKTVPAFSIYDFLLCNTKKHHSVFSWHPGCHYLPWGVDIDKFKPSGVAVSRPVTFLISAGWEGLWDDDRRGSLLALEAFRSVKGACRLRVYSQVPLEKMRPRWKESFSCDSRIQLIVGTFDPFPFNDGDVYLYPSRLDGIGLTLPEAVSSGLASIVTNAAPMNEFVSDNENGLLVDVVKYLGRWDGYYWAESVCSIEGLAASMQRYLDDEQLRNTHKNNARAFAVEHLDWVINSRPLLDVVTSVKTTKIPDEDVKCAINMDRLYSPTLMLKTKNLCACVLTAVKYGVQVVLFR